MDMLKLYVVNRAKEASTWRGVVMLLTAVGLKITPEMADAIISVGIAVAGLVGMLSSVSPVLLLPLLWWRTGQRPAWGAWVGAAMAVVGCALILA